MLLLDKIYVYIPTKAAVVARGNNQIVNDDNEPARLPSIALFAPFIDAAYTTALAANIDNICVGKKLFKKVTSDINVTNNNIFNENEWSIDDIVFQIVKRYSKETCPSTC